MSEEKCPCTSVKALEERVVKIENKHDNLYEIVTTIKTDIAEMKAQMKMFIFVAGAVGIAVVGVFVNNVLKG